MKTELFKMTEETTIQNGVEKKEVIQIETIINDDSGNEIGRLHVNKWGANFNLNNGKIDVQSISEGILGLLISAEEEVTE